MTNEGESGLYKDIELFLKEKEALWQLSENIPNLLVELGMPLHGQSVSLMPNDAGDRYCLILLNVPGNGCKFCGIEEPSILHNHHVLAKEWYKKLDSAFSLKLRLCPNCYSLLGNHLKERFQSIPDEQELSAFLLGYSYEVTETHLKEKNEQKE